MTGTNEKDIIRAASHLAIQRDYAAASSLLDKLEGNERSVDVLLLRGKIAAQQNNYEQAIEYWNDALALEPENIEAKEGIHTAQQIQSNPASRFLFNIRPYIPVAIIMVLLLTVVIMAGRIQGANGDVRDLLENHGKQLILLQDMMTTLNDNSSATEQRISNLEKQAAETENKSVSLARGQLSGVIEGLKSDISAVKANLAAVLTLSQDVQKLKNEWSKIESKPFGPGKKERDQMRKELTILEEKTDALLSAMGNNKSNPVSDKTGR